MYRPALIAENTGAVPLRERDGAMPTREDRGLGIQFALSRHRQC